jgi:hypothetical protein
MIELTRKQALKLREIVEQASTSLDDKTASEAPMLFGAMRYDGKLIPSGTRINWNGTIKRAAVDLWDAEENNPDNASTLWEDISYKEGIRLIPETITAGTAFSMGEQGWWKDVLYESTMNNNVWNPEQNPSGWKVVK